MQASSSDSKPTSELFRAKTPSIPHPTLPLFRHKHPNKGEGAVGTLTHKLDRIKLEASATLRFAKDRELNWGFARRKQYPIPQEVVLPK